jgi:hypothetical protein
MSYNSGQMEGVKIIGVRSIASPAITSPFCEGELTNTLRGRQDLIDQSVVVLFEWIDERDTQQQKPS